MLTKTSQKHTNLMKKERRGLLHWWCQPPVEWVKNVKSLLALS